MIPADILKHIEENKIEKDVVRLPTNIFGRPLEVTNYLNLLQEFKGQFRTSINPEGAKLPPFQQDIDTLEWEKPENQRPPRRIDRVRYYEMQRQINKMITNSILALSQGAYYCYPLLVPKPNDKRQLCVDYRKLNKISRVERWPIPNIIEMLYRIGDKRPKYIAVLDLTSGYHQIPISLNSREDSFFYTFWVIRVAPFAHGFSRSSIFLSKILLLLLFSYLPRLSGPALQLRYFTSW